MFEYLIEKHMNIIKYGKEYVYGPYAEITIDIMYGIDMRRKKKND